MNNGLNRLFYRETVQGSGVADGKVVRQLSSGVGVYAHVRVAVRALDREQGTIFDWNAGLNIPARFAAAVVQGIQNAMNAGVLAGLEMTDVRASVEDGSYHDVDSTASAFGEAAEKATAEALRQAHPIILEAFASVNITVPQEFVGAIEANVVSHGGRTVSARSETPTVMANLPTSQVNGLIEEILGISDGHASISITNSGFRPRPEPPDTVEQWVSTRSGSG
jgi:elongation factor G